jgi:uncharacterized membrane protein
VSIHFANPWALVLLVSLVPVVLWARRSIAGIGRLRGGLAVALRTAILLLLTLALAQARWAFTQDDLSVVYVLDQSLSIPQVDQKEALDWVMRTQKQKRGADTVGLVLFGRNAALECRPSTAPLLEPREAATQPAAGAPRAAETPSLQSVISPQRTNIAGAMRLGLAAFPPSSRKRLVVVSDGNENVGSAVDEAEVARRNGVRVDVWPVRYRYENEVMVEKVIAPAEVEKKASFEVRTVVNASRAQQAKLRVYESRVLIGEQIVDLKAGRNVFMVQRRLAEPGNVTYAAEIEPLEADADTLAANNRASAFTAVRGQGRILYVEGDLEHSEFLRSALTQQGLDVKTIGLDGLPLGLGDLIPFDAVILSNVSAPYLGEDGMRALELAVKDWGVGLVMVGGENAYGPGGYQGSPVERALPVSMDVKERRVLPSGALVIILHTCEIAQGNYWAREICRAALRTLSSTDEFGVVDLDYGKGGMAWAVPLQRATDKYALDALITAAQPGDMPDFVAPFQMAHTALKKSAASLKHVVVISDGDPSYPSDAAVLAMVQDKITVSTVVINPHGQLDVQRMAHVAAVGRGRAYAPATGSDLPQIFIKEAATIRRSLIFEEPFRPRVTAVTELVRGIPPPEYPLLRGYVVTSAKQLAEIPLMTNHDDPLLAHWQYGLGRATAFTSDAKERWAANWIPWDKYQPFWVQVIRWTARNVQTGALRVRAEMVDDRAHLTIDATDSQGRFLNDLRIQGAVVTPDHREVSVRVEQTGPGRYEADCETLEEGAHYVSLRYSDAQGRAALHSQGLVVPYSAEYRELKANEDRLRALAEATGGRVLTATDDVFARTFAPAPRFQDAWRHLLLAALLLAPLDVFVRRVFVDYRAAWAWARAAALPIIGRPAARRGARPEYVSALLTRKQLTREQLARRTAKFEPGRPVQVAEPTLTPLDGEAPPEATLAERPTETPQRPTVEREEDTYTGRLLKAKRQFKDEKGP